MTGWNWLEFLDINDEGKILGQGAAWGHPFLPDGRHYFIWDDKNSDDMMDAGEITETGVLGLCMNNKGQVAARNMDWTGWFWDNGGVTPISGLPGYEQVRYVYGVNELGEVVGRLRSGTAPFASAPFIWKDGVTENANDLLPAGSPWTVTYVNDINDRGQIAARAMLGGVGSPYAIVMTPVPVLTPGLSGATADITYNQFGSDGGYGLVLPGGETLVGGSATLDDFVLSDTFATMMLFYDPADLIYQNIAETTLRLYWYSETESQWLLAGNPSNLTWNPAAQFVMGDPTSVLGDWGLCMSSHFVWANVDHASTFAMAGHPATVPAPGAMLLGLIGIGAVALKRRFNAA